MRALGERGGRGDGWAGGGREVEGKVERKGREEGGRLGERGREEGAERERGEKKENYHESKVMAD